MRRTENLANRTNDGLSVTLLWDRVENSTWISYRDTKQNQQELFEVPKDKALDAYKHPTLYMEATA